MIEIIQASIADIPLIQGIAHQTWPATFSTIISAGKMNYMLKLMYSTESLTEQIEKNGHHFILAKNNQNCVGFASYELNYKNSKTTKIHKLYVLPETQGQGIGKLLTNEITELAKQGANNVLSLNVNRNNPSIQFYEKFGFNKIREGNEPIGSGYMMEYYVMEKQL
ncbi:GNAT family N-acetyltransferase [Pedobacter sp. WC2501]|uniref:GNAT family N-acetyltransferase n=1 Tax=Pedobacter sp. WC2501 TaxID=3461400 RepID=UPI0040455CC8